MQRHPDATSMKPAGYVCHQLWEARDSSFTLTVARG
ncbi:mCG1042847, isoform CRA_b [Mus musculus]|nr:mCG1042847, isoform CRA_b [Mus musculus]